MRLVGTETSYRREVREYVRTIAHAACLRTTDCAVQCIADVWFVGGLAAARQRLLISEAAHIVPSSVGCSVVWN